MIPADELKKIIERYLEDYPYLSNRRLAKLIIQNENLDYDVNSLRQKIPKYRKIETQDENWETAEEPVLPDSWYEETKNYVIPQTIERIAILSDIHIPFHDKNAVLVAIDYAKKFEPEMVLLNGDILDCYAVSRFNRDPLKRDFSKEIEIGRKFLEFLTSKFKGIKIVYKFGNHEMRLQNYLWNQATELSQIEEIELRRLLRLSEFGIDFVSENSIIEGPHLFIAHGHEIFAGGGMVNVARSMRLRAFDNIIVGHFHRTQEDIWTNIGGKPVGGWAIGCLCGLNPPYRPISFWNHGFALLEIKDKTFSVENKKIVLGKVK
jgi:predicted phosphodiesterase